MDNYANEIYKVIADYVEEMTSHIKHDPITPTSMLSPIGLDSIGRAFLIEDILERLNLTATALEFQCASNLGELAEMFANKLREKELNESKLAVQVKM